MRSPLTAAKTTFALKAGEWFRRGRLLMVSPVHGDYRRCQAEIPLIVLFRFPGPALKVEEATIGLALLCSLPVDVVERALIEKSREMTLILAKALDFSWETTMSLLFLRAKDHRISARDLDDMKEEFVRLNTKTSRSVLEFYQSRKSAAAANSEERRLPQLHNQ